MYVKIGQIDVKSGGNLETKRIAIASIYVH